MKYFITAIVLILVVILALGVSSSLLGEGSLTGIGGTTTTAAVTSVPDQGDQTDPDIDSDITVYNRFYSAGDSTVEDQLASYSIGSCLDYKTGEESGRILIGYSMSGEQTLIAFSFNQLEVGKTYLIRFYHSTDLIEDPLYYRFNSSAFKSLTIGKSSDGYHTLIFEAQSSELHLGVVSFSEKPSNDVLNVYAEELKEDVMIDLYEVMQ